MPAIPTPEHYKFYLRPASGRAQMSSPRLRRALDRWRAQLTDVVLYGGCLARATKVLLKRTSRFA